MKGIKNMIHLIFIAELPSNLEFICSNQYKMLKYFRIDNINKYLLNEVFRNTTGDLLMFFCLLLIFS